MKNYKPNVGLEFLPSVPPEITWDPGEMHIRYEMDKLNFDWRMNEPQFEFTPSRYSISPKYLVCSFTKTSMRGRRGADGEGAYASTSTGV